MLTVLDRVDSIIGTGDFTAADSLLGKVRSHELGSENEKALYYLLKMQTDLSLDKPVESDSALIFCIDYYKATGDNARLARAYYYKGVYDFAVGDTRSTLLSFKKAESINSNNEPPYLRYLINVNLSYINSELGANRTALEYGEKALEYAKAQNNISWICFAYNNIASCFMGMKKEDSAFIYIKKIIPYLNKIDDEKEHAMHLTNVGYFYYRSGAYRDAERMQAEALRLCQAPTPLINLGMTYTMLGREAEADSLFRLAWVDAGYAERAELLQFRAERAEEKGDFKASAELFRRARAMQDSVEMNRDTEGVVVSQREYEQKNYRQRVRRNETEALAIAVLAVIALTAAGVMLYRRKMNKVRKTVSDGKRRMDEYTARIKALEQADRRHSDEARRLERKIRRLKDEQNAVINRGKSLYEAIMSGGNTSTWKKNDFDEFIEYYRMGHPDMVAGAENGYRGLSSTNMFYLILADMGIDESGVQRIMCMSPGAVRTMKSRIKSKMKT